VLPALDLALAAHLESACARVSSRARAAVMLSGGETPRPAYALVARRRSRAHRDLHIVYSDERHVPPDSEASNYGSTKAMLEALRLANGRVLRVRTELPLREAADDYEAQLARLSADGFGIGFGLFGLGADGHTASLFSADDLERAEGRLAIGVHRPDGMDGVSVTPSLIARVAEPMLVVAGAEKRGALASFVRRDPELIGYRAFSGCARVNVWADAEAYPQERVQP